MLAPLLEHWRERPQRTWSVVVTVFGDAVVPRGGAVGLGALTALMGALGIDAGAVRTAMSRLARDGWTARERAGRNSIYRLTAAGRETFEAAAAQIYAGRAPDWDGQVRLLVGDAAMPGWGQVLPGLWMAPGEAPAPLTARCEAAVARALAARAWPLERLAGSYARFTAAFAGLAGWDGPPLEAMAARTLLIHEYRRIVLHAPDLPEALLPPDWPGGKARALCAAAYKRLLPASEAWLDAQGLPPPGPALRQRF